MHACMLSVLIVNWNTRELLRSCLSSLAAHPPREEHEIIVVDNASADESARMVREAFPAVRLLANQRNEGYARGNNQAFAAASGEWLLTLNPDTEVTEGALQTALETLELRPEYGCLGAQLVHPDGRVQRSVRGWPSFWGIVGEATGLANRFPASRLGSYRLPAFDYTREGPAPQPMGTFLLFRRRALEEVGDPRRPFDEAFPIFFNEVDLLYRLAKAGWPCLYTPRVKIVHHGAESTKLVRKSMIWESHRSLLRFLRKHHRSALDRIGVALLAPVIHFAAFVRARGYHAGFGA